MSLTSYGDVFPLVDAIRTQVSERSMPPWIPAPGCNEYAHDRSLSDEAIRTLVDWVDGGAAKGDPATEPPPAPGEPAAHLERVDFTLSMPEAYAPMQAPDEYRCFVLPWPEKATSYVRGFHMRPGTEAMVHHAVLSIIAPENVAAHQRRDADESGLGYTCFSTSGTTVGATSRPRSLGSWEPGAQTGAAVTLPEGTGLKIEPGSAILLQQHYNTWQATGTDQSGVDFQVESSVTAEAKTFWFTEPLWAVGQMPIPAGESSVRHEFSADATGTAAMDEFEIHWVHYHMHQLGKRGGMSVVHSDGSTECIIRTDPYRFDWQQTFELAKPIIFRKGDLMTIDCEWDNSPGNQHVVNGEPLPTRDVNWGDTTRDEMCLGELYTTPVR
jgi:hypothetical protein